MLLFTKKVLLQPYLIKSHDPPSWFVSGKNSESYTIEILLMIYILHYIKDPTSSIWEL